MIPISHIGTGKTFGELALQINKENPNRVVSRAATITCITNCKFATMSKTNYQTILDRIDQKNTEKIIEFLREIPYLKYLTRGQLAKVVLVI